MGARPMTDAVICDRCGTIITDKWTGPMFRIRDKTGTGKKRVWDLCPGCHSDIRDELWELLDADVEERHEAHNLTPGSEGRDD